ncbi:hypothetical protein PPL_05998 [Heterostelium album PN500]|uniref:Uncharacterized protein n=1 Tax=Heterostelium pallidum (strain ATCC 26659 / Pp 5 / PN500) TaxID=670386 RepID=D3BBX8_HETP5|nr:hypothetical protein PPL_05998 [Heterostelium album PN500]EFA81161.1 hypothetical protein PPL_05998 [Heterostelium album PN500]|eukprot:XP_020433279.1 hypothetical protein PPL_05998 [Heterostelium album PN500]
MRLIEFYRIASKKALKMITKLKSQRVIELLLVREPQLFKLWPLLFDGCCRNGMLDTVKLLCETTSVPISVSRNAMDGAAAGGHLDLCDFLRTNRTEGFTDDAFRRAAKHGHLQVFQWLNEHSNHNPFEGQLDTRKLIVGLIKNKQIEMLQYLIKTVDLQYISVMMGHIYMNDVVATKDIDLVKFMFLNPVVGWFQSSIHIYNCYEWAVRYSQPLIMEWLWKTFKSSLKRFPLVTLALEAGSEKHFNEVFSDFTNTMIFDFDKTQSWTNLLESAAAMNRLDVVQYLTQQNIQASLFVSPIDCAVKNDHYEMVSWLLRNRTEQYTLESFRQCKSLKIAVLLLDNQDRCASQVVIDIIPIDIDLVNLYHRKQLFDTGAIEASMTELFKDGPLDVIQFLLCNGYRVGSAAIDNAAGYGNLELVKWIHSNTTEAFTTRAMDLAAEKNHLEVVKFLHYNRTEGCTMQAVNRASLFGHCEMIDFLLQNRTEGFDRDAYSQSFLFPAAIESLYRFNPNIDFSTSCSLDKASMVGSLEVVIFLDSKTNCKCTTQALDEAASFGFLRVVEYLLIHRKEGFTRKALVQSEQKGYQHIFKLLSERLDLLKEETN